MPAVSPPSTLPGDNLNTPVIQSICLSVRPSVGTQVSHSRQQIGTFQHLVSTTVRHKTRCRPSTCIPHTLHDTCHIIPHSWAVDSQAGLHCMLYCIGTSYNQQRTTNRSVITVLSKHQIMSTLITYMTGELIFDLLFLQSHSKSCARISIQCLKTAGAEQDTVDWILNDP